MQQSKEAYAKLVLIQDLIEKHRRRTFAGRRPEENPTVGQGAVIASLRKEDGQSTKELSRSLGVGISTINETIAKMEKAGLVVRRQSSQDGRVMLVHQTERGRAVQQVEPESLDVLAGFSDKEAAALDQALDRVIANLQGKPSKAGKKQGKKEKKGKGKKKGKKK